MNDLSPDRTLTIHQVSHTLDGSFGTLKAVQTAFGRDILDVLADSLRYKLRFDELALLIRLGIEGGGTTAPDLAVVEREVVEEIGINQAGEIVMEWLMAATSPKRDRAGNVHGLRQALAAEKALRLKAARPKPASRGGSTAKSA